LGLFSNRVTVNTLRSQASTILVAQQSHTGRR
jgi:hypothetical protein